MGAPWGQIDYDALAKQYGATSSQPAAVDYDALAKQYGAISSTAPQAKISAPPERFSKAWFKEQLYNAVDKIADSLPAGGGMAGAMIGGASGATGGSVVPGAGTIGGGVLGATGGAAIGGMAGEAARQLVRRAAGFDSPQTGEAASAAITKQGLLQGGIEAASGAIGNLSPWLRNAAEAQYVRALAPTTKATKAITQKIVPEMIERGVHGSMDAIEQQADQQAVALRPQLNAAYAALDRPPVPAPVSRQLPSPEAQIQAGVQQIRGEAPGALLPARSRAVGMTEVPLQSPPDAMLTDAAQTKAIPNRQYLSGGAHPEMSGTANNPGTMSTRNPQSIDATLQRLQAIANDPQHMASFSPSEQQAIREQVQKLSALTSPATGGAPGRILRDLDTIKGRYIVNGKVANQTAVDAIDNVQQTVAQYGPDISYGSLRRLRQVFDESVAAAGGYTGTDLATKYTLNAQKAAAGSIRDILHQASPDVAALDKEMSFWLNVQKVTGASALRQTGQQGGLVKTLGPLGMGVGAAAGLPLGATGAAEGAGLGALSAAVAYAVRTPQWRTVSAVFKDRLADAMARGDIGAASALLARFGGAVTAGLPATRTPDQTAQPSQ